MSKDKNYKIIVKKYGSDIETEETLPEDTGLSDAIRIAKRKIAESPGARVIIMRKATPDFVRVVDIL